MKRTLLLVAALGGMFAIAGLAQVKKPRLLLLDWAAKAASDKPPVAVLIELGLKDPEPKAWPGQATVSGARVVHREGYRFRGDDKLVEPNGWSVSSHRTAPPRARAAVARPNPPVSAGVVVHLADVQPDAALTLELKDQAKEVVALKDILGGQTKLLKDAAVAVRLVSTATPVVTGKTEDDFPAAAYGPDGTLWLAYISYTLKDETHRANSPNLDKQPENFRSYYKPEFGDQLFVKAYRNPLTQPSPAKGEGSGWSEPIAITGGQEDLVRCGIAVEGNGTVWVGYSANRKGNFDIYVRPISAEGKLGAEQRLTQGASSHIGPVLCTDQAGNVWLAYQAVGWSIGPQPGLPPVYLASFVCRNGQWTEGPSIIDGATSAKIWSPAIAAGPDGQVAVAHDAYGKGDYDVHVALLAGGQASYHSIATSAKFEARPSLAYDGNGRLWIAYEEGPAGWGKDFGALDKSGGNPLYNQRTVRVVCLDNGKLMKAPEVPAPMRQGASERTPIYSSPRLGVDGQGHIWLTYRQKLFTAFGTPPGTNWITVARRSEGDHWSPPIDIHHSDGLLDSRPVVLPSGGGITVLTNTDGRYAAPGNPDNQIFMSRLSLPGEVPEAKLTPHEPGQKDGKAAAAEAAAVNSIRDYTLEHDNKKHKLLRGEFHRHTEISFDGGNDGSLEDMFRYAIDCAAMDWIGNGDHDNGGGREYTWWLVQKFTDAYLVRDRFTPMFTYERSVPYPHGHRNCMFARRGIRTLPRLAEPAVAQRVGGVHADDAKMLYRYLHELGGICASHTSATTMGTDWRDYDAEVEPLVEIYQGARNNYEYQESPRAGHDPAGNRLPASLGGWEPAGFIVNAFKKGVRFGFQSSSDHVSTHISYCVVVAEKNDRDAIVAACKKRHAYGATDDIILDVKSGNHMMGDAFKTNAAPALQINVQGTKPLAAVHVLKDSEIVHTFKPSVKDFRGDWTDPKPTEGTHYYYVRVEQVDEELAWASPMWIEYAK